MTEPNILNAIIPSLIVAAIIAVVGWIFLSKVAAARLEAITDQHTKSVAEIKEIVNGFGERLTTIAEGLNLMLGVVVGMDGRNGLKSDVRTMQATVGDLDRQVAGLAMGHTDLLRRMERVEP